MHNPLVKKESNGTRVDPRGTPLVLPIKYDRDIVVFFRDNVREIRHGNRAYSVPNIYEYLGYLGYFEVQKVQKVGHFLPLTKISAHCVSCVSIQITGECLSNFHRLKIRSAIFLGPPFLRCMTIIRPTLF